MHEKFSSPSLGSSYNPFVNPHRDDPYPFYARARQEEPVFYSPMLNCWAVARYDDVLAVLKDPKRFSSADTLRTPFELSAEALSVMGDAYPIQCSLISDDPPAHTRLKGIVAKALTPRRITALEPRVRELAQALVDEVAPECRADLVARFTSPLSGRVLHALLGVPPEDSEWLRARTDERGRLFSSPLPADAQVACARGWVEGRNYLVELVEARRKEPRDDLLSDLVRVRPDEGDGLSSVEIADVATGLLAAGTETTMHAISLAVRLVLDRPDLWRGLLEEPELASAVFEEALRVEAPVQGMFRVAREDVALGGAAIPKESRLYLLFGSANRDEAYFPDGERFDARRVSAAKHLGLGMGIHYCVGAPLVRLEGRVALEVLRERLPGLRLATDEALSYLPAILIRGFSGLPVAWD